ncbi:MAG: KilA-N domain-containing protein [Burkholderia gladioli]
MTHTQGALALTHTPNPFTVGSVAIRELDGLFSLNDLHKASGGEAKHRPGLFLSNLQTKSLITEISNAGIPVFKSKVGANGGTYACRELVIAYAAWISAAFHLKVIRVFLDATGTQAATAAPASRDLALTLLEKTRWMLTVQNGHAVLIDVSPGAVIVKPDEIADLIQRRDGYIPLNLIPDILAAAVGRLGASGLFNTKPIG